MTVLNGLSENNRRIYNITFLSAFGLAAISGIAEFEGLHAFVGYAFSALMVIHARIYWKNIKGMFR